MIIRKGTKLEIRDRRKGRFYAIANADFDTNDEWYDVILEQDYLEGLANDWVRGEHVPARNGISEVRVRGDKE